MHANSKGSLSPGRFAANAQGIGTRKSPARHLGVRRSVCKCMRLSWSSGVHTYFFLLYPHSPSRVRFFVSVPQSSSIIFCATDLLFLSFHRSSSLPQLNHLIPLLPSRKLNISTSSNYNYRPLLAHHPFFTLSPQLSIPSLYCCIYAF